MDSQPAEGLDSNCLWSQFCVPENRSSRQRGHGKTWGPPHKFSDLWEAYWNTQTQSHQATWGVLQRHCEGARGAALG